jgi:hypothetical protein
VLSWPPVSSTSGIPAAFWGLFALGALGALGAAGGGGCGFDGAGQLAAEASGAAPPAVDASVPPASTNGADAGSSVSVTPPCTDQVLGFDGIDDVATVADDAALELKDDFTVEAWIKPGAKVTAGTEMDLVSHHDASASRGWVLLVKDGRVELVVYGNETLAAKAYSAGDTGATYVVPGKWAHVAGTRQGDMLRVYYDGVLRDSQQLGFFFGRDAYSGALRLGRAAAVEDFRFQGELDDVRISTTARYTGSKAPKPAGVLSLDDATVASWRFDEASGTKLVDATFHGHDGSAAADATAPARIAGTCIPDR